MNELQEQRKKKNDTAINKVRGPAINFTLTYHADSVSCHGAEAFLS